MKILLISTPMLHCFPRNYGGSEQIVGDLCEALIEKGHKVVLAAPKGSTRFKDGLLIESPEPALKVHTDWLKAEQDMYDTYYNACKDVLDEFDAVHGHGWFMKEFDLKHPNTWHSHHGGLNTGWVNHCKINGHPIPEDRVIAISKFMKDTYNQQGFACKHFCYNGVNLDKYKFSPHDRSDRLLFVGRIDRFKQPHIAIEVARKLNVRINLVGGTFIQDKAYLNQIRSLCDGSQIRLYENASHEKKIELMQKAKCVIFPGIMSEPFGLVPLESMACGTPVIALNDGAIPEIIQEGGIVCNVLEKSWINEQLQYSLKKNPVDAICEALPEITTISSRDCRANAKKFSREKMADNYIKIYNGND